MRILLQENRLPLIVAETGQIAIVGPIEELAALVRPGVAEKIALIVAVEMHAEILAGRVVTLQQLLLDVRLACGCDQRRRPVLGRKDVVDLDVRRDKTGPAYHCRDAIASLPIRVLLAAERGGAAIGPGEGLGTVVGRVD